MRIAVIGAGNVGATLGAIWAGAGHEVVMSFSRDPAKLAEAARGAGGRSGTPAEAVAGADAVLLAVPWAVAADALAAAGPLAGVVLVDATNPLGAGPPGVAASPSAAAAVAELAPGARVVKAFNTVFAPMFAAGAAHPGQADLALAGDDPAAKEVASRLVRDAGFVPVDLGGLDQAADLEAFARLVIGLAYRQGRGPFTYRFAPPDQLAALREETP